MPPPVTADEFPLMIQRTMVGEDDSMHLIPPPLLDSVEFPVISQSRMTGEDEKQ